MNFKRHNLMCYSRQIRGYSPRTASQKVSPSGPSCMWFSTSPPKRNSVEFGVYSFHASLLLKVSIYHGINHRQGWHLSYEDTLEDEQSADHIGESRNLYTATQRVLSLLPHLFKCLQIQVNKVLNTNSANLISCWRVLMYS